MKGQQHAVITSTYLFICQGMYKHTEFLRPVDLKPRDQVCAHLPAKQHFKLAGGENVSGLLHEGVDFHIWGACLLGGA